LSHFCSEFIQGKNKENTGKTKGKNKGKNKKIPPFPAGFFASSLEG